MIRVCPLPALPPGEAVRVDAEPLVAVFHTGATRWRRQLNAAPVPA